MRFRKSIRLGKGIKLNLSKSGASLTAGIAKGLSVNLGKNGAYLNTGIPGTGFYDRRKIGGNMKKTFGHGMAFFIGGWAVIIILFGLFLLLVAVANNMAVNSPMMRLTAIVLGIGALLVFLLISNSVRKAKNKKIEEEESRLAYQELAEAERARKELEDQIRESRISFIKSHELFGENSKIFIADQNNIIAFSDKRFAAVYTSKTGDDVHIFEVDHITKITQELKSGPCSAHLFTDIFETPDFDLYLGYCSNKADIEEKRGFYNEIKNMYTMLKKNKGKA